MFIVKNKYFLIIESIKDIDLEKIKKRNKFYIVYRSHKKVDKLLDLLSFREKCKSKAIKFYIANDLKLAISIKSDGLYLSSFNRDLKFLYFKRSNFELIGSAHNVKEITTKIKQGCSSILLSKLFLVDYDSKSTFMGVVRFNKISRLSNKLIPLGGIKIENLNQLNNVFGDGFALLSEIKKKPAIISRLF
tara:strand:+ start:654 stop:1223 length:570 start_codon:yes stop_codon:yes gene_type:complete